MSAARIRKDVADELYGNVRIVHPGDFLDQILRLECDTKPIAEEVKKRLYKNEQWKNFPDPRNAGTEEKLYKPLIEIANAVNKRCAPYRNKDSVQGEWLDAHSVAPESRNNDRVGIEPDIVFVSRREDVKKQLQLLREDSNDEVGRVANEREDAEEQKKHRANLQRIWWLHIHVCIEVKAKVGNAEQLHSHIIQLCAYMRQMFREQLDRRFVIGLLLCGSQLTMWLCDRSGLVGTIRPINIHKEPDKFVQVLSSFTLLPASRIGWNPTMMIYQSPGKRVPSYLVPADPTRDDFEPSLYHVNWVISMPTEKRGSDDPGDEREEFITVRAIVAASSQRVSSRATVVWEVVKLKDLEENLDDIKGQEHQVFVLKQSWQQTDMETGGDMIDEAEMYNKAALDHIISAEHVKIAGERDTTTYIRGGSSVTLKTYAESIAEWKEESCKPVSQCKKLVPGQSRKVQPRDEDEEPFMYMKLTDTEPGINIFEADSAKIVPRSHERLLSRESGYSIRDFTDLSEFARAFLDCIKDHKRFCDMGVLHRDVSAGNMLLRIGQREEAQRDNTDNDRNSNGSSGNPVSAEINDKIGRLIDLDHAKWVQGTLNPYTHDPPSDSELARLQAFMPFIEDPEVLILAWRYFGKETGVSSYLATLYEDTLSVRNPNLQVLTRDDLKWPKQSEATTSLPDFSIHEAREGFHRTGTIPYMSVEVLRCELIFGLPMLPKGVVDGRGEMFFHDIVHDLESFLWVMIYICLTRGGPLGQRRQLEPAGLTRVLDSLFNNDQKRDIAEARVRYLQKPQHFRAEVLSLFDPYFDPLKKLAMDWLWTLRNAYKHRAVEYHEIYYIIMNILQETLEELHQQEVDDGDKSKERKDARYKKWAEKRKFPKVFGARADANLSATTSHCPLLEPRASPGSRGVVIPKTRRHQKQRAVLPVKTYQTRTRNHEASTATTQRQPSSPSGNRVAGPSMLASHPSMAADHQAGPSTATNSRGDPSTVPRPTSPSSSRQNQLYTARVRRRNSSPLDSKGTKRSGRGKRPRLG